MDALDLTTGERISSMKAFVKGNRRKASAPQRRQMVLGSIADIHGNGEEASAELSADARSETTDELDRNGCESPRKSTPSPVATNLTKSYVDDHKPVESASGSLSREMSPGSSFEGGDKRPCANVELKQIELLSYARDRSRRFQYNINNNSNGIAIEPVSNISAENSKKSAYKSIALTGDFPHSMLPPFSASPTVDDLMQQRLRRYLDDVQPAEAPGIPERTKKQNRWAFNVWREWARKRNMLEDSFTGVFKGVPLDVGQANEEELDYWLCKFVMEIRRKDGNPYPPHTLMQIVMGIQRYLRQQAGKPSICILDRSNPIYSSFRSVLDYRIKELASNGTTSMKNAPKPSMFRGAETKIAKYVSSGLSHFPVDLPGSKKDQTWNRGLIGTDSAHALLNAVFYHNHKTFDIQYIDDHWNLRAENFTIHVDNEAEEQKYLEFTPSSTSMMVATGKANGVQVAPKRIEADPHDNQCVFSIYEKYLSLIPKHGPFYRHPVDPTIVDRSIKFSDQWVGKNRLRAMLKHLIDTGSGLSRQRSHCYPGNRHNNHSPLNSYATSLIQLPGISDAQSSTLHEKLGVIKPLPPIRASDILSRKLNDHPSYRDDDSGASSPKRSRMSSNQGKEETSNPEDPCVTFDGEVVERAETSTANDNLEITVPTTIKSVTILKGSRKITIQLD